MIDEFLRVYPEFVHEPEPYTVLVEQFGEEFAAEPRVEDFIRQLEFNIARLDQHERGANVIYERCPIDFLAYIECVSRTQALPIPIDSLVADVSRAIQNLDLIVYLPIEETIEVGEEEFPKLRKAVDRRLGRIYGEDEFGIVSSTNIVIVGASGTIERRLQILETAVVFEAG